MLVCVVKKETSVWSNLFAKFKFLQTDYATSCSQIYLNHYFSTNYSPRVIDYAVGAIDESNLF